MCVGPLVLAPQHTKDRRNKAQDDSVAIKAALDHRFDKILATFFVQ